MKFTFGENWLAYSRALDARRVAEATESVARLIGGDLAGRTFVDVGAGSGLFSIAAAKLQAARVVALDRDADCISAIRWNLGRFLDAGARDRVEVSQADVLRPESLPVETFDVVYAWGSLHHTGAMWQAIENTSRLCARGGVLVLAIYNRTRWSRQWHTVKHVYNGSPNVVRLALVATMAGTRGAIRVLKGRSPFRSERGMSVWFDSVDWLGGLPYEYATRDDVEARLRAMGFHTVRCNVTSRSGCNEFVFGRT